MFALQTRPRSIMDVSAIGIPKLYLNFHSGMYTSQSRPTRRCGGLSNAYRHVTTTALPGRRAPCRWKVSKAMSSDTNDNHLMDEIPSVRSMTNEVVRLIFFIWSLSKKNKKQKNSPFEDLGV